ncbi:polyketide synthase [Dulcicalothrix desertica PCC 7102]|uniref:Polyketide synthase n=1 Tax=Dulcicalothrix desertica PCC 7102 TaxID=232991 RepID=A0A433V9L8_9CYAN|nr:type I polyketide synthase [Dulcicalothrix desertica]RUT02784.1 polyketide synthase [Dulcicalothrix desertica PCC 7102]TWH38982.1 enediyne polyketide synthase [Dulcicalothrix desertica PCC 7102]
MTFAIAIVGMACRYPDAASPIDLWSNVLAQRRSFRQIPPERLNLADYMSADRNALDCTYTTEAALIEGYEFDRVAFRVAGNTFRAADLAHWLALDVAELALADAGFSGGEGLPRDTTAVLLGNTLTGEFSRANTMRLRWPYVRRVVEAALAEQNCLPEKRWEFLNNLEAKYKAPFPIIGEETLAGNLSNTIAGRICNHFNLKGGGYTIDGACSSSLLAVTNAASALVAGDIDVAIAGGVDLSIDPFELVGFAKAGALAESEMRVYDTRSEGFFPGEGCGCVVLMRYEDAIAHSHRIYAIIRGWGVSSDGSGGITRPEVEGQMLALKRTYHRAGFGIETVSYFEGHGTGTSVGDAVELQALSRARRLATSQVAPAVIGSIKANIGHTKAAAGVAGLIKATMALHTQILPPTTGSEFAHPELTGEKPVLQVLSQGKLWSSDQPLRAGVSAMGFGGINTHIVLESPTTERRQTLTLQEYTCLTSSQDTELILIGAEDIQNLRQIIEHLLTLAPRLSRAEVIDLAASYSKNLDGRDTMPVRAAIIANSPKMLTSRLKILQSWLTEDITTRLDNNSGVFLGNSTKTPCIGFLFPGQASPTYLDGGLWSRFEWVRELYNKVSFPIENDRKSTIIAQPAIVTASTAALQTLEEMGITASIAVGHSLGEITALYWAGALDVVTLLQIATVRGKAMAAFGSSTGAMASIQAAQQEVELLKIQSDKLDISLDISQGVVIAGFNSPRQTVISGDALVVTKVVERAKAQGIKATILPVSHAFHSPMVAAAAQPLAKHLAELDFQALRRTVVSTVTGELLPQDEDLRSLLIRQVTAPVKFIQAVTKAVEGLDLLIEVGPGQVLSNLVKDFVNVPTVALDASGSSLSGLWQAVGAAFALGTPIKHKALFAGRFTRPFNLDWHPRFFTNPCELAPLSTDKKLAPLNLELESDDKNKLNHNNKQSINSKSNSKSALELLRQLVAERAELPPSSVQDSSRMLSDLHLNSITVSQLVAEAARCLKLPPPIAPTDYADASVSEIAQALEELSHSGISEQVDAQLKFPQGVDAWIRSFTVELVERSLPHRHINSIEESSWQVMAGNDYPLLGALQETFKGCPGGGIVVCLPTPDECHLDMLFASARKVLVEKATRFVLVQHGGGGASFARTLYLEAQDVNICIVDVPIAHPDAAKWIMAEALATVGYSEAHYDSSGKRFEPCLRLLPLVQPAEIPLSSNDVLLVTGGGKGIAAECALSIAQETGVRLALLGRSLPETDTVLSKNLERITAAGVHARYISVDVIDAKAVQTAVTKLEAELGKITAILHGAGTNVPQLLSSLDKKAFINTLAPKVQGARNLIAAINPKHLRLFITFGSIIANTGLRGEAHYGLANEWLALLMEKFQEQHSSCRCLNIAWSIWSGVGMGERLGRIDTLIQQGITPISPDRGIDVLRSLISHSLPKTSVVVTGRFGLMPTLKIEQSELPFLRFLESQKVYYPELELIVDIELSTHTDPYLKDHVFQGEQLFPAVMGLEAMAQVAMALAKSTEPPIFESVKFNRPVVVPDGSSVTIRIAALIQKPGQIEVVLRSTQTAFQVEHFQAICVISNSVDKTDKTSLLSTANHKLDENYALNPERDIYGAILFHSGRFRRLRGYKYLRATKCVAEIMPDTGNNWFSHYLPQTLVLGDPGARDAAIHALQACIPHATILPIGVDRLIPGIKQTSNEHFVYAQEQAQIGDTFIYDLEVTDINGCVLERWEGLRLKVIKQTVSQLWAEPLLAAYIERQIRELVPSTDVTVVIDKDPTVEHHVRSERAIKQAIGVNLPVFRRPDGKPEVLVEKVVSVAHADDLTIAVAGQETVGCDAEVVRPRTVDIWQDLLTTERFKLAEIVASYAGENLDIAATRIWAASECLKKAGAMINISLMMLDSSKDGRVVLAAGQMVIATLVTSVRGIEKPLVLALLVKNSFSGSQHANL